MDIDSASNTNGSFGAIPPFLHALRWFDDSRFGLAVLAGSNYQCIYANAAFIDLAGRRKLQGEAFFEVFPELRKQGLSSLFDKVVTRKRPCNARGRWLGLAKPGGLEWRVIDVVLQPAAGLLGEKTGLLVQCHANPAPLLAASDASAACLHDAMSQSVRLRR